MSKRRVLVGMVSIVLVAVASLAIHIIYQANSWPSLDEEPPLARRVNLAWGERGSWKETPPAAAMGSGWGRGGGI